MKYILLVLSLVFSFQTSSQNLSSLEFDVVICGGTPAAIMAAIALDREGKSSVIIERSDHIGGLPANGLGATDIKTKGAVGGLFKDFIHRVNDHYVKLDGNLSREHHLASHGYHFEPSVAEQIFEGMIIETNKVTVLKRHQFDVSDNTIVMKNNAIESIKVLDRNTGNYKIIKGQQFIDATYEGDLLAATKSAFKIGRESKDEFNEPFAGKVYKYWDGDVAEGTTYEADNAIQAFNYRLCITDNPEKRIAIAKPEHYNREEYVSLIEDIKTGRHTGDKYGKFIEEYPEKVKEHAASDGSLRPMVPGNPEGIERLVNITMLPNDKTDANNQQLAFISTDLPEENWFWPNGSWDERDAFAKRLKDYTLGLFWFAQNDSEVPLWFRQEVSKWGLDKDEYVDNEFFPRQVYVREGRRMVGVYHFTAIDALPVKEGERPPIHKSSITAGHYSIDSHGVRKREKNRVNLDGFLSYGTKPFNIPYGTILPKTVNNLLAPVPVSATHLGFSAIRLEPTWMALGEAAGIAASIAIDHESDVQNIDIHHLQKKLLDNKAVLHYYEDLSEDDKGYKGLQILGLNGIYREWKAHPNKKVTQEELIQVEEKFNVKLSDLDGDKIKRFELAEELYKRFAN